MADPKVIIITTIGRMSFIFIEPLLTGPDVYSAELYFLHLFFRSLMFSFTSGETICELFSANLVSKLEDLNSPDLSDWLLSSKNPESTSCTYLEPWNFSPYPGVDLFR